MTDSLVGRAGRRLVNTWQRAAESSRLVRSFKTLTERGSDAVEESKLASVGATIGQWVRGSWLYRWLTAEPNPEVIVIDLRETLTVGPFITIFDWLLARFVQWWETALLHDVVQRLPVSFPSEALRKSRTIQVLVAALEPPELPEQQERSSQEPVETDRSADSETDSPTQSSSNLFE